MDCPFQLNDNGLWQCPECDWVYKLKSVKAPRRNCPKSPDLRPAAEKLGIEWKDVAHYAHALARWMAAGFPVREQFEVKCILHAVCRYCVEYEDGRCEKCGCGVNTSRVAVLNKIKMKTESCPEGKW